MRTKPVKTENPNCIWPTGKKKKEKIRRIKWKLRLYRAKTERRETQNEEHCKAKLNEIREFHRNSIRKMS